MSRGSGSINSRNLSCGKRPTSTTRWRRGFVNRFSPSSSVVVVCLQSTRRSACNCGQTFVNSHLSASPIHSSIRFATSQFASWPLGISVGGPSIGKTGVDAHHEWSPAQQVDGADCNHLPGHPHNFAQGFACAKLCGWPIYLAEHVLRSMRPHIGHASGGVLMPASRPHGP